MRIATIWPESSSDRRGISTAYTGISPCSFIAIVPSSPTKFSIRSLAHIFVTGPAAAVDNSPANKSFRSPFDTLVISGDFIDARNA